MQCPHCAHDNQDHARFCEACGKPLSRVCRNCSTTLTATARFCPQCGTPAEAPDTARPAAAPVAAIASAERRQLTVLFCDLVGSTALSTSVDPEQLRELMRSYQQAAGAVFERYEGHVAQYLGDGLMVYFGWPRAHEDDVHRAVHASLEIIEAVKSVGAPQPLQVRIGIATGPVVVGETGAGDASVPKLAVGETPNIAARLQSLAGPDQIVISPATQRLLGTAFEYEDLGPRLLKGVLEPMHAWRVIRAGDVEGRFDASHGAQLTPLVGREEELALLLRRWEAAVEREGQVVLLCGEPGIGKSRIMRELRDRVAREAHGMLACQCSPFHANSSLHPFVAPLERAADIARADDADTRVDKLAALLRSLEIESPDALSLLAAMLSIEAVDRLAPIQSMPQRQRDDTLALLREVLFALSRHRPLLILFEDIHWIDPTSLEALDLIVSSINEHPVLLVVTFRPEFGGRWTGQSHVSLLNLNRLPRRQIAAMIARVTGGRAIPQALVDQIVAKTDGVPLFVEELTKATLESGMLRLDGDEYLLSGPLTSLAIPSTLQDSLMARLDRLSEVREVAQIGACIGRDFSYELLAALGLFPAPRLQAALDALTSSELVFNRGTPPNAIYTFKHALIQDAAYASLLNSRRQYLHGLIAQTLETKFATRYTHAPHVIAHHHTTAGAYEQAIGYWLAAGQQAVQRFANTEAVHYIETGLGLLERLPGGPERDRQELLLQMTLGHALGSRGYTPPEVGKTFARARVLCQSVGETPQMMPILFGLWIYYIMRAEYADSRQMGEQILSLADRIDSRVDRLLANYCMSGTLLFIGDLEPALHHAQHGLKYYRHETDGQLGLTYGFSFGPCCLDWASIARWMLGYPEQSDEEERLALDLARSLNHPVTQATVTAHQSLWRAMKGDVEGCLRSALETIELASKAGVLIRQIEGELMAAWAWSQTGQAERGIAQIERSIALWHDLGAHIADPIWLGFLSDAYFAAGRLDDAAHAIGEGLAAAERYGEHCWDAELTRRAGAIAVARSPADASQAEAHFVEAIRLASAQRSRTIELRAAVSLARLWQGQGKRGQAHDLLEQRYAWFTEGFDTKDLREAKALLEELRA